LWTHTYTHALSEATHGLLLEGLRCGSGHEREDMLFKRGHEPCLQPCGSLRRTRGLGWGALGTQVHGTEARHRYGLRLIRGIIGILAGWGHLENFYIPGFASCRVMKLHGRSLDSWRLWGWEHDKSVASAYLGIRLHTWRWKLRVPAGFERHTVGMGVV
jgi:hypothetical protein